MRDPIVLDVLRARPGLKKRQCLASDRLDVKLLFRFFDEEATYCTILESADLQL